jgi:hypothetical protein
MISKLTSTCVITAMINTVKMEARAGLLQATTRSNDGKALRHGPALEALQTEIWVLEDLAGDRMEQIGGGQGSYTRFKIWVEVLWALRMGGP